MLTFYHAMARKLRPLQPLWLILALASLGWLGYLLLLAPVVTSQRWQLTALVSFAFMLNMMLLSLLFGQPAPAVSASDFWSRLQARVRDIMQYLLAGIVSVLFLIILWLFLRIGLAIIASLVF